MPSEANDGGDDDLRRLDENLFEAVADLLERPGHHERMAGTRARPPTRYGIRDVNVAPFLSWQAGREESG